MVKENEYFDLLLIDFVYEFDDGQRYYQNNNGVLTLNYYSCPKNITMTAQWVFNLIHLELDVSGKTGSTWKILIRNNTGATITVEYNEKMCYKSDAQNWTGLNNVKTVVIDKDYNVETVNISENWFATSITVSFVHEGKRYITYADNLNANGTLTTYTNVIDA